jgi:predicted 2-oxoglutarate/Fe(II)-dependent dioxygenase YbiX
MDINHQIIKYNNCFTKEQCEHLVELCDINCTLITDYSHNTAGSHNETRPLNLVQNNSYTLDRIKYKWVYDRLFDIMEECNEHFLFDINKLEPINLIKYNIGDHYKKHHDLLMEMDGSRKLTISIQLSSSEDYTGADLILHTGEIPVVAGRFASEGIAFVANIVHEVTAITEGTRYALVVHCSGPKWK